MGHMAAPTPIQPAAKSAPCYRSLFKTSDQVRGRGTGQ